MKAAAALIALFVTCYSILVRGDYMDADFSLTCPDGVRRNARVELWDYDFFSNDDLLNTMDVEINGQAARIGGDADDNWPWEVDQYYLRIYHDCGGCNRTTYQGVGYHPDDPLRRYSGGDDVLDARTEALLALLARRQIQPYLAMRPRYERYVCVGRINLTISVEHNNYYTGQLYDHLCDE